MSRCKCFTISFSHLSHPVFLCAIESETMLRRSDSRKSASTGSDKTNNPLRHLCEAILATSHVKFWLTFGRQESSTIHPLQQIQQREQQLQRTSPWILSILAAWSYATRTLQEALQTNQVRESPYPVIRSSRSRAHLHCFSAL